MWAYVLFYVQMVINTDNGKMAPLNNDQEVTPLIPVSRDVATREVEIFQHIGRHENIVPCYAAQYLKSKDEFHIFLGYVSG